MNRRSALAAGLAALAARGTLAADKPDASDLAAVVKARESAFAKTMADRDFKAFLGFVSEEAVFVNGGKPLVGRQAVGAFWQRFFEDKAAPFSWEPDIVVVLASGKLGSTTGPVADPQGQVNSRFYSTWRLEDDGQWRVVFDNGYRVCRCKE